MEVHVVNNNVVVLALLVALILCRGSLASPRLLPSAVAGAQTSRGGPPSIPNPGILKDVQRAKADVRAALKSPRATFASHMSRLSNTASSSQLHGAAKEHLAPSEARYQTFLSNLAKIEAMNEATNDSLLAYGLNDFTHLTAEEFASTYLSDPAFFTQNADNVGNISDITAGGRRRLTQAWNAYQPFPYSSVVPPASVSWYTSGKVTVVKDQNPCGSCAAFTVSAALEAAFIAKWGYLGYNYVNTNLREQEFLQCTAGDQCQGYSIRKYADYAVPSGVALESANPYTAVDTNANCGAATHYPSGAVAWTETPSTPTGVAQGLTRAPVMIAVEASGQQWQHYNSGIFPCTAAGPTGMPNHAITVVAYRDSYLYGSQYIDYYMAKNSWGPAWGNSGFLYLQKNCPAGSVGPYSMYTSNPVMFIHG